MTSRQAASHFFTDADRAISREAPDIRKLVEIGNQHDISMVLPGGASSESRPQSLF
jgi:hypothetical protein